MMVTLSAATVLRLLLHGSYCAGRIAMIPAETRQKAFLDSLDAMADEFLAALEPLPTAGPHP